MRRGGLLLGLVVIGVTLAVAAPAGAGNPGSHLTGRKAVSGDFVEGGTITYAIDIANDALGTQGDNAGNEFIDVLPTSLTLVSATATSGTAVANLGSNTVIWNGSLTIAGSVDINVTATIGGGTAGTTICNQGTISYDSDGNGSNDSTALTDDLSVAGAPDPTCFTVETVDATFTVDPAGQEIPRGGTAAITLTVTNTGSVELRDLAVTDDEMPDCDRTGLGPLAPGDDLSWTCGRTDVQDDYTNTSVLTADSDAGAVTRTVVADVTVFDQPPDVEPDQDTPDVVAGTPTFTG